MTIHAPTQTVAPKISDRISILWRLLIPSILAVIVAVTAVESWSVRSLARSAEARVARDLQHGMDFMKARLHPRGEAWSVDADGHLMVGGVMLAGRNDIVDAVRNETGAIATIFEGDRRIATNLVNPDGSRAVNTVLGAGAARDAVIGAGQSYSGENLGWQS